MEQYWSLNELYPSFESDNYRNDYAQFLKELTALQTWSELNLKTQTAARTKIAAYLERITKIYSLYTSLSEFASLTLSVDVKNDQAMKELERLEEAFTKITRPATIFANWLKVVENLDSLINSNQYLQEHRFYLKKLIKESEHLLSEQEEELMAQLKTTGSSAWSKLHEHLTATLLIKFQAKDKDTEEMLPLSIIRNFAYHADQEIRKKAYEAELAAYPQIENTAAACLNSIKGEVLTICSKRGYETALDEALVKGRIDRETLAAMLSAIEESLPDFQKYYRKKAELLGHQNGLPFYELFAPLGDSNHLYSYTEAQEFIIESFATFSDQMADFAKKAFAERWIDAEPREGKRGGAFCCNLHPIKQSRILCNFNGYYDNLTTIAHELGHGYHGQMLIEEAILNSEYPMTIAETASIFAETIVMKKALTNASESEKLMIIENDLASAGQVIVDIYSRYLFETAVFEKRSKGPLSSQELQELMLEAQRTAYGDGLDPEFLHPYMWVNKPHYYYAETNFYNFPYAVGLLFSKGLYAEYQKRGDVFVSNYNSLLRASGRHQLTDLAGLIGLKIREIDFWRASLNIIKEEIEEFLKFEPEK